jgi:uncharacterized caspase-like protein
MTAEHDFALVIGIAHYPQLQSLEGPVLDAQRIDRWLRERAGLPDANVELVTSAEQVEERPILEEVDAAFERIFKNAKAGGEAPRRLYVYFAGHGCSQAIDHVALLMANANLDLLNRAMNATEYRKALGQRLFPEQIYLFDCCRQYDRSVLGRGPEWTFDPAKEPLADLTQVVLYAAGFTQYANERHLFYSERRGLFTEALMEGLNGAAGTFDKVRQVGVVTTDRLVPYVYDRLNDLTRSEKVPTRQNMGSEAQNSRGSLNLAEGITPWRRQVNVTFPPGTTEVVAQDERSLQLLESHEVGVDELSTVFDLELASYTFTAQPSGACDTVRLLPGDPLQLNLGGS